MTFEPKPISKEGVPLALQKAERYRVINDPSSAESICLDVLEVDPDNQQALVTLLLAITDQFAECADRRRAPRAGAAAPAGRRYQRAYYAGIICERCAKAQLQPGAPRLGRDGVRLVSRGDDLVREGGGPAPRRQRRGDPPLEHLRPPAGAQRPVCGPTPTSRSASNRSRAIRQMDGSGLRIEW